MARVERMLPGSIKESLRRVDHLRTDMGVWLTAHADRRQEVQRQIFWIVIDIVIIFLLQVLAVTFYDLVGLFGVDPEGIGAITYMVAIAAFIGLMLPPLLNILSRVRVLGLMLIRGVMEGGHFERGAERRLFRAFVDIIVSIIGVVLFFLFIPIAPQVDGLPTLVIFGSLVGVVIAYLLWDANRSAYDHVCHLLTDRLHDD